MKKFSTYILYILLSSCISGYIRIQDDIELTYNLSEVPLLVYNHLARRLTVWLGVDDDYNRCHSKIQMLY